MGYRSNVRISTNRAGYKELFKSVSNSLNGDSFYDLFSTNGLDFYDEYKDSVIFGWDYVKWYEEYDEVSIVMDTLKRLGDKYPFEFIRVGEDDNDVDHKRYGDGYPGRRLGTETETRIVWW